MVRTIAPCPTLESRNADTTTKTPGLWFAAVAARGLHVLRPDRALVRRVSDFSRLADGAFALPLVYRLQPAQPSGLGRVSELPADFRRPGFLAVAQGDADFRLWECPRRYGDRAGYRD